MKRGELLLAEIERLRQVERRLCLLLAWDRREHLDAAEVLALAKALATDVMESGLLAHWDAIQDEIESTTVRGVEYAEEAEHV